MLNYTALEDLKIDNMATWIPLPRKVPSSTLLDSIFLQLGLGLDYSGSKIG